MAKAGVGAIFIRQSNSSGCFHHRKSVLQKSWMHSAIQSCGNTFAAQADHHALVRLQIEDTNS